VVTGADGGVGRRSPRCTARQRLPYIGLGQAELPGDPRLLDANVDAARTAFSFSGVN
jgi:hypothetical protein